MRLRSTALIALSFGAVALAQAAAQEIPALKGASAEEQTRVTALIEAAKIEGSLSYWDTVIQPATNDALVGAFRTRYGLPSTF
jgi:hypothetical protein